MAFQNSRKGDRTFTLFVVVTVILIGIILSGNKVYGVSALSFSAHEEPGEKGKGASPSGAKSGAFIDSGRGRLSGGVDKLNNELHSTNFNFNDIGDEDTEGEEDTRENEDGSYYDYPDTGRNTDSSGVTNEDVDYIQHFEQLHEPEGKPQIGKCCPPGQGLNVQGLCHDIIPIHLLHHEKSWFPDLVFDGSDMIETNITEWDIKTAHRVECPVNESAEIVSDMARFAILKDGGLYLVHHTKIVSPLNFCVDQELGKGEGRVVRSCFSRKELCGDRNCLRKCCPDGAVVEEPSARCSRSHRTSSHHLHNGNWSVIHANPSCPYGQHLYPIEGGFNITDGGSLVVEDLEVQFLHYCLDHFINVQSPNAYKIPVLKALICFEHDGSSTTDRSSDKGLIPLPPGVGIVYGIAFILSSICLAFAAAISWRLPELRSLHGKCQLSHLGTLFCLFVLLAAVHLGTASFSTGLCTFVAVAIHMCALSSFLWLNLLCVNIYLTFRSLRPPLAARRDENRRLFFLCVYAWGIPAAFCMFLFILDSTPGRLDPMPRPEYGVLKCLISSREAEFAYLFGPVGVLLLCNGLLFCLTAQELLCGLWRLDNSDSISFRRKSMGIVVAKLGIVMGMGWILDVMSWAVGADFPYMFYAADFFNALQGVFICIVLVWRKRVLEVLHLRKPSLTKDDTLTARPFLHKNSINTTTHADHDTSLVIVQEH